MRYAPLPWVHLADALRPPHRRLRFVLAADALDGERSYVRLYDGPRSQRVLDAHELLDAKPPLSARERAAVEILAEAGPSHARKGAFALLGGQLGRLLPFAQDVSLELEDKGGIVMATKPSRIVARVIDTEDGAALIFEALNGDDTPIQTPKVLGEAEAFLLDESLVLYRVNPPLLPGEARALLLAEPLILPGVTTDEGRDAFEAVVNLGVDLSDLIEIAERSEPAAKIWLRALLTSGDDDHRMGLRVHLVTELHHDDLEDEAEVPARGALAPVYALERPGDEPPVLVARPVTDEATARTSLFGLGLTAAGEHRGFTALGERALDILVQLTDDGALPAFVHIDEDTLPSIVRLPSVPRLEVSRAEDGPKDLLRVRLDIGDAARALATRFDDIAASVLAGHRTFLVDEDTVLAFTPEAGRALEMASDALELPSADAQRDISEAALALLAGALGKDVKVVAPDDVSARLKDFLKPPEDDERETPPEVLATLRPYQQDGMAWLNRLHQLGLGRILADDMGLGKTLMALSMIAWVRAKNGPMPTLVVAPTSVIDVWAGEVERHMPDLSVLRWHGRERLEHADKVATSDIIVTSYALLRRDIDGVLGETAFRYLLLDEAQHVKNPRTEAWKAARRVNAEHRLALTGTPIENRVEDMWSILELVAPGLLGTERVFQRRYGGPIAKGDVARLTELRRRIRPVVLRRKKEDVAHDLPPKIESVLRCAMGDEQRGLYLRVLAEVRSDVQRALELHKGARARAPILAALMRLRQVCCDPALVLGDDQPPVPSAKRELFKEMVAELLAAGRRIIVFSQFVKMQKLIKEDLAELGVADALWLHGGTRNRGDVVAAFQKEDGPKVIVVSLKAGGTGVTLTAADTVIHYDPWWNPAVEDQATDRAHRIGQTRTVHVIKLACEDSIEERMLALSADKRAAAEGVLGRDKPGPRGLTVDEMRELLGL